MRSTNPACSYRAGVLRADRSAVDTVRLTAVAYQADGSVL
jgi:hypothetical protein